MDLRAPLSWTCPACRKTSWIKMRLVLRKNPFGRRYLAVPAWAPVRCPNCGYVGPFWLHGV